MLQARSGYRKVQSILVAIALDHGESYRDLLYTRRRFITRDQLRAATTSVTNAKMLGIVKRKRKSALLAPLGHFPNLNVKLP